MNNRIALKAGNVWTRYETVGRSRSILPHLFIVLTLLDQDLKSELI